MIMPAQHDYIEKDGERFIYRDGNWINNSGYLVATDVAQRLTLDFYEQHKRPPASPKTARRPRRSSKAERAKADALRASICRVHAKNGA